jgi:N6-adenosine-specific RNA methylase IME4
VNMGLGDWLRGQTEHCILAVKGRPIVSLTNQTTIITEKRREHSRKPLAFYSLVEALCPGSKLEMFAREGRDGWARWGAEAGKFDAAQ